MKVAGCNMWVMEETDGPSRDSPQMSNLDQKLHTQQCPTSSSKKRIMSLRMTLPVDASQRGGANEVILSQKVHSEEEKRIVSLKLTGTLLLTQYV